MATHSSIFAWRIPWTKDPWQATVHRVTKSQTWLKWLSTSDKEPNSNIYQDILDINKRKTNNPIKICKTPELTFQKRRYPERWFFREMQIKTTMRYRYTANGVVKSKTVVNAKGWQECGSAGIAGGQIITVLWETAVSSRTKYMSPRWSSNSTSQEKWVPMFTGKHAQECFYQHYS